MNSIQYLTTPSLHHANNILSGIILICAFFFLGCNQTQFPDGHLFRPTAKPVVTAPLVLDCNSDGKREIVIRFGDGHIYFLDDSLRDLPDWRPIFWKNSTNAKKDFFFPLIAWDIERDGFMEIFMCNEKGKIMGWHLRNHAGSPAPLPGFPIALGSEIRSSPTMVADSLLAIGGFEKMFVFDHDGKSAWGWPQTINGWTAVAAAWSDDVLAISSFTAGKKSRGYLYAWHLNGELYLNFPIILKRASEVSPALADLDGDDRVEIILGDDAGVLHVFTLDGSELPGFPRMADDRMVTSPMVMDFDRDGVLDIIAGTAAAHLYVWNSLGDLLLGWPVAAGDEIISSVAVANIHGNGRLAVVVGSKDHHLYAFYADGSPAPGFPIDCGDKIFFPPWVGDLDGNGRPDIVVAADNGIHRIDWPNSNEKVNRSNRR